MLYVAVSCFCVFTSHSVLSSITPSGLPPPPAIAKRGLKARGKTSELLLQSITLIESNTALLSGSETNVISSV